MKATILNILKNEPDYLSGEELSRRLGITRSAVWKYICSLRKEGYTIESGTNKGYRLVSTPDSLDSDKISENLKTVLLSNKPVLLKTVDSTNEEVKRRAAAGADNGLILAAEQQTKGKGRLGRSWSSDQGGLYFSLLLRPELPPEDIASITLAAGYGVCLAIRNYTGLPAMIKWPNDIVIENRKLCGILTEMTAQIDRVEYVVIGIGINVNDSSFPAEIAQKATSLQLETGKPMDRNDFFRCVIKYIDTVLASFEVSISEEDLENFKQLCITMGREVTVEKNGKSIKGTAVNITSTGELVIHDSDGKEWIINSGEVSVQGIY